MRTLVLVFLLFFFVGPSLKAQVEQDKVLHFAVGAATGAVGAFVASELSNKNRFWTVTGAIGASLLAGLAKEYIDEQSSDNSWDNTDLGATVLGGITVGITIDLLSKKNGKYYQSRIDKYELAYDTPYVMDLVFKAPNADPSESNNEEFHE